jgi:hypothetical protein
MLGSRPARWRGPRQWGMVIWVAMTLTGVLEGIPAGLAQPRAGNSNPDWPCRQILVGRLSAAALWSGPPIEGVTWRSDHAVADLVAKVAGRRTPLEDAGRAIDDFARSQGAGKRKKLLAVFAGLFETLDEERSQVIEGLLHFGAKQKELADKIRAENALPRDAPDTQAPDAHGQEKKTVAQDLQWDLRVFDERQQALTYVCESPTLIEQRLFALAKIIQRNWK